MKKIISLLTVLLLCTQTVISVFADETEPTLLPIETEFIDANFLAAVREIVGKTNDEPIYKSDVEGITELDVSEKDIKDMHGIEYFTGLKTLMCYTNYLEELDLSHNTELEVLDCSINLNLESLDVSYNTNLKNLDCSYSAVEELNLENNLLLEKLDTCQMKLTSLDVTKNKNLKRLDCSKNRLTELDLSNNTNLERVICSNNYMDSDASKSIIGYDAVVAKLGEPSKISERTSDFIYYPQRAKSIENEFTDANFLAAVREITGKTNDEHIYKSDVEGITELDVSDKEIKDMHGIEYFTGLKKLMCYANEIEELDLSHNTELEVLDCSLNLNLGSLDVSHNTNLKNLDCSYSAVEELNLENNLLLEKLDTCQMKLTSLDVTKNKNLKRLDCSRNRLTELDLSNNTNLERVICSNNYMDSDASKSIIGYDAVIAKLGEPSKSSEGTSDFIYYPQRAKSIENEFTDANFLAAVREITGKTNDEHIYKSDVEGIKELDISDRDIKDLHGIEYFTGLETLICFFGEFSEIDLSHNTNLVYLDFSYNPVIKTVDLSHNLALETVKCQYTSMESLDITNNINLKKLVCFATSISELNLENNTQLEVLNAYDMRLTNLDISKNINLRYLDCSYNQLTSLDAGNNTKLELLMCDHNYMDQNPQKGIIGYDMIVEQLGEPETFDNQEVGFVYYPQREKVTEETYPYEITGLCLKDTSGADIEKPQENQSFIVEADVIKTAERDEKDYLFVAVYDTDGALISLDYVKAKFVVDGECSFGFNIPAQEKSIGSIKVFVWNAFNSMEPLAESKTLSFDIID